MIEVVFSENTKASMTQLRKDFKERSIDGSFQEILNIGFSLDIGDISGKIDGKERKEVFYKLRGINFDKEEEKKFFNQQRKDLEKLLAAAKEGEDIRIWESSAAFSVCGVYFVCDLLKEIDCKISIVSFPEYHKLSNKLFLSSSTWSSILPEQFHEFLIYEKKLEKIIKQAKANHWEDLRRENSPLRAVVNGKLISVEEDFYDHIILRNMPKGDFTMIDLIGKIIGEFDLGLGDTWLILRIEKMIEEGVLKVLRDKKTSNPYSKVLRGV